MDQYKLDYKAWLPANIEGQVYALEVVALMLAREGMFLFVPRELHNFIHTSPHAYIILYKELTSSVNLPLLQTFNYKLFPAVVSIHSTLLWMNARLLGNSL